MLFILDCTVTDRGQSYYSEGMEYVVKAESENDVLSVAFSMMKEEGLNVSMVGDTIVDDFKDKKYPAIYTYKFNGKRLGG